MDEQITREEKVETKPQIDIRDMCIIRINPVINVTLPSVDLPALNTLICEVINVIRKTMKFPPFDR